eukprot:6303312-Amphidinium_carterae.1
MRGRVVICTSGKRVCLWRDLSLLASVWQQACPPGMCGCSDFTVKKSGDAAKARHSFSSWASQETPNPKVRKFELMESSGAAASALDSHQSLLARQMLLGLGGVRDVFLGGSLAQHRGGESGVWISVTREDGTSWDVLTPQVHQMLETLPSEDTHASSSSTSDHSEPKMSAPAPGSVEEQIMEVLDERVRPGVQADGGDVRLISWDAATKE